MIAVNYATSFKKFEYFHQPCQSFCYFCAIWQSLCVVFKKKWTPISIPRLFVVITCLLETRLQLLLSVNLMLTSFSKGVMAVL